MRRFLVASALLPAFLAACAPPAALADSTPAETSAWLRLEEFVTDPQHDWDGSGSITGSDEWFEIRNVGSSDVALEGWTLLLEDTTPAVANLGGTLGPGERFVVANPPGEQNNHGRLLLRDAAGRMVDEVVHGTWNDSHEGGRAPHGDATGAANEAVAWNGTAWRKTVASPGRPNGVPLAFLHGSLGRPGARLETNATHVAVTAGVVADPAYGNVTTALLVAGPAGNRSRVAFGGVPLRVNLSLDADGPWSLQLEASNLAGTVLVPDAPSFVVRDREGPRFGPGSVSRYANATRIVAWPAATDHGVGGVTYRLVEGEGNASIASPWSAAPQAVLASEGEGPVVVRVETHDRLGNGGPPLEGLVRFDPEPPAATHRGALSIEGDHEARLSWPAGRDGESYVASYVVGRIAGAGAAPTWHDAGNETTWTDRSLALGQRAWYLVAAVDAAGNRAPAPADGWVEAKLGMHTPRVAAFDAGPARGDRSTLRAHVAFDRPMESLAAVEFRGDAAQPGLARPLNGTWDADRRAWSGHVALPGASVAGRVWVVGARDAHGNVLPLVASPDVVLDRVAPRTELPGSFRAWMPTSRVSLSFLGTDDLDSAPVVEVRAWRDGQTEATEGTRTRGAARVTLHGDGVHVVRFRAEDAAGNREPWRTVRIGLDGTPPAAALDPPAPGVQLLEVRVRVGDATSGLGAAKPVVRLERDGWIVPGAVRWDEASSRAVFTLDAPASPGTYDVFVDVSDRAGNPHRGRIGSVTVRPVEEASEPEVGSREGLDAAGEAAAGVVADASVAHAQRDAVRGEAPPTDQTDARSRPPSRGMARPVPAEGPLAVLAALGAALLRKPSR